ncbi:MAG: M48 family metallopeptidase [Betaproteobacteria bacterium]
MTASTFTLAFLLLLALYLGLKLWLDARQMQHVRAHRDRVPAQFAERISLTAHQKAADYTIAKTRLGVADEIVSAVLVLALTLGGGLAWLYGVASGLASDPLLRDVALLVGYVVLSGIVGLPLSLYGTFGIEARFGFNKMTWQLWFADLAKGLLLGVLLGLPLAALILWLMQSSGPLWWLYAWLAWCAFQLLMLVLYPTLIAPFFNKFTPLEDGPIKARIEALLARCGFQAKGLFVMDGSRRSAHGNAYFTGFGAAKRIVFFDTLLKSLDPGEVEAVLAHELGHFKRHHIVKRIAWTFGASLLLLWILSVLMRQPWFYAGLGVPLPPGTISNGLALLLFALVAPLVTFPLSPLLSAYSRKHEFEADAYAAQQSSAGDLAHSLVKMYEDNAATLTPDPLHSAFYDSHPPAALRIARLPMAR